MCIFLLFKLCKIKLKTEDVKYNLSMNINIMLEHFDTSQYCLEFNYNDYLIAVLDNLTKNDYKIK